MPLLACRSWAMTVKDVTWNNTLFLNAFFFSFPSSAMCTTCQSSFFPPFMSFFSIFFFSLFSFCQNFHHSANLLLYFPDQGCRRAEVKSAPELGRVGWGGKEWLQLLSRMPGRWRRLWPACVTANSTMYRFCVGGHYYPRLQQQRLQNSNLCGGRGMRVIGLFTVATNKPWVTSFPVKQSSGAVLCTKPTVNSVAPWASSPLFISLALFISHDNI